MKRIIFISCILLLSISLINIYSVSPRITYAQLDHIVNIYSIKYAKGLVVLNDTNYLPRSFTEDTLRLRPSKDWTSGFFPGTLWYLYEFTDCPFWKNQAHIWTRKLEPQKFNTNIHDVGFMMYCSYGNGYRLTGKTEYKDVLLTSAQSLSSRFNSTTGLIRSWGNDNNNHQVIIDNMMNLELLFWAAQNGGKKHYEEIAVSHANKTIKNHFRDNNSTWHVVEYNPNNGNVELKRTHQGLNDNSTWARGQSWAIYGYTMCCENTSNIKYLSQAQKSADYFIEQLPSDTIPFWDFNLSENCDWKKETSAAAIAASALLDLYALDKSYKAKYYLSHAENLILKLMEEEYLSDDFEKNHLFVLKHSNGSVPHHDDYDAGINYADYYYLEALLKYRKLFYTDKKHETGE